MPSPLERLAGTGNASLSPESRFDVGEAVAATIDATSGSLLP